MASVVILALGGMLLVGLDTVGSQGRQLAQAVQPETTQASEAGDEAASNEGASGEEASGGEGSGDGERGSGATDQAENADKEQAEQASVQKPDEKDGGEEQARQEPKDEDLDPPAPESNIMSLSIPSLGMQGDTVYDSSSLSVMDQGAIKLPPTGFPWQENANTYISAHRIGYPGTESRWQFWELPAMQQDDAVYLTDANGTTYEYRVTDKFAVKPWENWVTEPQPGGDMITLQTCVLSLDPSTWWDITPALMESGPDTARLVVQAEKVETYPAS